MQKRFFVLSLIVGLIWNGLLAEIEVVDPLTNHDHNFAIIVDQTTYAETGKAVANYRDAIEKDNLACYILIAKNSNPEEIKDQILVAVGMKDEEEIETKVEEDSEEEEKESA